MAAITSFTGNVLQYYDAYLGPLFFEPYAIDLMERLGSKQYENVLELACGTGRVTNHLIGKVAPTGKLYATDLNADMLSIAKTKLSDERIVWEVADAQNLSYSDNTCDLVVCQYGVMFFPDKPKAFAEAKRVLKSGGSFLFNTWDSLKHNVVSGVTMHVLKELFPDDVPSFFDKGPYSFYNTEEIKYLLQEAGFSNISIETVAKNGAATSVDDVVKGIIEGTPAISFLTERNVPVSKVEDKLRERLVQQYGETNLQLPMQAFVCEVKKP